LSAEAGLSNQTPKPDSTFEGESSLSAHSNFINEFLDRAITRQASSTGTSQAHKDDMLAGLRQFMTAQKRRPTVQEMTFDHGIEKANSVSRPPLPPFATVAALLREERGNTLDKGKKP